MTPFLHSPSVPLINDFEYPYNFQTPAMNFHGLQEDYRRDSVTTDGSVLTYSSGHSPIEPTSFDEAVSPEDAMINHNDVMNCNFNTNFGNTTFQQPTPAMSNTAYDTFDTLDFSGFQVSNNGNQTIPHLSPGARADVTLVSSQMPLDEGFEDGLANYGRPTGDFTLFDATPNTVSGANPTQNFFPELSQFGGQFDSMYDPTASMAFDEMMGFENQH
jgi:hypothetical protein